jgi:two-component system, cell cycle response regulator DivK
VANSTTPLSSSVSVLIVDDSAETRDMYEYALSHAGFRVLQADNGADGLSHAAEALPDVIVTDLSIPKIDGFALLTRVQTDPRTEQIPVIILSGSADTDTPRRAIAAGATAFLLKPCSPESLIAEVRRAVCASRA